MCFTIFILHKTCTGEDFNISNHIRAAFVFVQIFKVRYGVDDFMKHLLSSALDELNAKYRSGNNFLKFSPDFEFLDLIWWKIIKSDYFIPKSCRRTLETSSFINNASNCTFRPFNMYTFKISMQEREKISQISFDRCQMRL